VEGGWGGCTSRTVLLGKRKQIGNTSTFGKRGKKGLTDLRMPRHGPACRHPLMQKPQFRRNGRLTFCSAGCAWMPCPPSRAAAAPVATPLHPSAAATAVRLWHPPGPLFAQEPPLLPDRHQPGCLAPTGCPGCPSPPYHRRRVPGHRWRELGHRWRGLQEGLEWHLHPQRAGRYGRCIGCYFRVLL